MVKMAKTIYPKHFRMPDKQMAEQRILRPFITFVKYFSHISGFFIVVVIEETVNLSFYENEGMSSVSERFPLNEVIHLTVVGG